MCSVSISSLRKKITGNFEKPLGSKIIRSIFKIKMSVVQSLGFEFSRSIWYIQSERLILCYTRVLILYYYYLPKKAFEIANKFVHVSFAGCLMYDVLVVIIPKTTAQLFVVHFWLVLAHAPPAGHLVRVCKFEFPVVARPGNERLTGAIGQQLQQELPQLYGAAAGETRTAVCNARTVQINILNYIIMQNADILQCIIGVFEMNFQGLRRGFFTRQKNNNVLYQNCSFK